MCRRASRPCSPTPSAAWARAERRHHSARQERLERLALLFELRAISIEVAGVVEPRQLLQLALESDRNTFPGVRVGHPASWIRLHERLDLLCGIGVEKEALVRPVGEIGRPLLPWTAVFACRKRARVRGEVRVRVAAVRPPGLIDPEG